MCETDRGGAERVSELRLESDDEVGWEMGARAEARVENRTDQSTVETEAQRTNANGKTGDSRARMIMLTARSCSTVSSAVSISDSLIFLRAHAAMTNRPSRKLTIEPTVHAAHMSRAPGRMPYRAPMAKLNGVVVMTTCTWGAR